MIRSQIKENSSVLLAIGASVGVLATAYFSASAGYKSAQVLSSQDPHMDWKERTRRVWKLYIPAGLSATTTVVCVAGVKHVDGRKTLAAQTALAVSQRAYESYREQVVEELGERKDKTFLANVKEKEVQERPPPPGTVVLGSGTVLCMEAFTGRYFDSDMEALNKAVNELNARMMKHDYATLDDFYYLIGLQTTTTSGQIGWRPDRLLELEFSTVLAPDNRPCLAFDYNYVKSL